MKALTAHPRIALPRLTSRHLVAAGAISLLLVGMASAGVTGDEFKDLYEDANRWAEGYLGRAIAMLSFILGAGWSAARQNMMPVIFGIILAIIISIGPNLLDSVLSATV